MDNLDTRTSENPNTPLRKAAMEYALILSLIGIALMLAGHFANWGMETTSYKIVSWLISVGMIVWMVKNFRDQKNGGFLRFGQGVGLCALTGLFAGIITAIFFYIFVTYVSPEFVTAIHDQAINDMAEKGMSDEQIAQSMEYAAPFMSPGFMSLMALIGSVVSYTLIGLIVSAIFKRD